eukprot:TRINITY_DN46428_c0_g1_i1.p1 TRINITY_DN46428_c0_g1~~TRINITY_DN46428_c0_g1_i1.p1  ORF type:complete len:134 (-),score=8.61 TRINITY_DN46428_c0_g1_i1:11-412(-)
MTRSSKQANAREHLHAGPERFFYDRSSYTGVHRVDPAPERGCRAALIPLDQIRGLKTTSPAPVRSKSDSRFFGPERFYYDKSSYTGVYARGGPKICDYHDVPRNKTEARVAKIMRTFSAPKRRTTFRELDHIG